MSENAPGFFGKLPSRGDFVSRRLPADFVSSWDAWLASTLAASRAALGEDWLDVYLTSPIWRFALASGICGEEGWLGVVMPSVDRVGRYFPLAVAVSCGRAAVAPALAAEHGAWFAAVERALLATLEESSLELEAFDERVSRLPLLADTGVAGAPYDMRTRPQAGGPVAGWHRRLTPAAPERSMLRACVEVLGLNAERCGTWWTHGSERMDPCVIVAAGLPDSSAAVAMLDGRWREHGWDCQAHADFETGARALPTGAPLSLRSAAVTDPGKVREANEDSFACRDDLGVWIAADGLGGHQAGDVASAMVTSVVAQLEAHETPDVETRVAWLESALGVVNGCLRVLAERDARVALAASTVTALLTDGSSAACVWAGDSRAYRLRAGQLEQLSRDHSEAGGLMPESHVITRAVGGGDALELEVEYFALCPGDRYLLCTDGLYGEVSDDEIAAALALPDPHAACRRLKQGVLEGEARDNLTAIVVHVGPEESASEGVS